MRAHAKYAQARFVEVLIWDKFVLAVRTLSSEIDSVLKLGLSILVRFSPCLRSSRINVLEIEGMMLTGLLLRVPAHKIHVKLTQG